MQDISQAHSEFSSVHTQKEVVWPYLDLLASMTPQPENSPDLETIYAKLRQKLGVRRLIGQSARFKRVIQDVVAMAQTDASVLILGESGTGKELCARAIHYLSAQAEEPFVSINCGAIPVELVENELFGHSRGSFTGAIGTQEGVVREAEGGTLFLDEIDTLSVAAQVKLLRFLEEKEYRPLGTPKSRQANVRIISATNTNVSRALATGALRHDFYYRVNTLQLELPALRDRLEDLPTLTQHFLTKYTKAYKKAVTGLTLEAAQILTCYAWPGNIRELEHVIARAVALSTGAVLQSTDFLFLQTAAHVPELFNEAKARVIADFEKSYVQKLLIVYNSNISKAAKAAGKHRRAFWELMRKHDLHRQPLQLHNSLESTADTFT
jgi:two-component system, NtrC family, response regulator GlrR